MTRCLVNQGFKALHGGSVSGEEKGEHGLRYVHLVNNEDSCFLISSGTLECRGSTLSSCRKPCLIVIGRGFRVDPHMCSYFSIERVFAFESFRCSTTFSRSSAFN